MASILSNLSDDLAAVVAATAPGLVRVEARRHVSASGIVFSVDGLIVTAHHVVEREDNILVGLEGGKEVPATLVGRDPTTDLALLRIAAGNLTAPAWVEPDELRVGHLALALGRPGKSVSATLGIVSALGDSWLTAAGGRVDRYLQSDAVMYPGFSGGPLVSAAGGIAGLNTSALRRGVAFTLPAPTVRRVVETLVTHGRVSRGYLGVGTNPVRLPAALAGQLGQETGLLIASVAPESPAEKAGLLLGDTIVALGGQPVRSIGDLLVFLSGSRIGETTPVRVVRGGQSLDVSLLMGESS